MVMSNKMLLICCAGILCISCTKEQNKEQNPGQSAVAQQSQHTASTLSATVENATPATASTSQFSAQQSGLSAQSNEFNIQVHLNSDVLFDFGQSALKPEALPELEKVANTIRNKGHGVISITGHTDSKGTDQANQILSLQRAESIQQYFIQQGLNFNYQVSGKGESEPVAPNEHADGSDNPEGRQQNRRVDIVINKAQTLAEQQQPPAG